MSDNQNRSRLVPRYILVCFLFAIALTGNGAARAQEIDPAFRVLDRVFLSPEGFELVVGQFVGMVDGKARITDSTGKDHQFAMAAIHEDDRKWMLEQMGQQRRRVDSRQSYERLFPQLLVNRPAAVINACRRIRSLERTAGLDLNLLLNLLNNSTDEQVKYEALLAYVAIMPATQQQLESVLSGLTVQWKELTPILERKPEEFLIEAARLGEVAIPYLQHVIYGGFVTPPRQGELLTDQMQVLADDDVDGWRTREAGIKGVAIIRDPESAHLILQVLSEAEKLETESLNERMVRACLVELGNLGIDDGKVQDALAFHASRFPVVVENSRKQIENAQQAARDRD